jgi:pimeloyl-ACP methyl ester carboxylesterase
MQPPRPIAVDERVPVAAGVSLHVRRWLGDPTGRPFLLVHGLSSNAHLWDEVATQVAAAGHNVTAIDLRSHGTSDAPEAGYDTATAADDVAAVATSLGVSGAVVAGQSWGGDVVVQVAARHPATVAALALLDGGWSDLSRSFTTRDACETALRPPDIDGTSAEEMRGYFRGAHPDWSETAIEATLANVAVAPDGTVSRHLSIPHHMQIVRSMWDDPPKHYYPAVAVPVLLMPALAANAAESRDRVDAAAQALGDAIIREYVDADHDIHAQRPADVAADLLWLAQTLVRRVS